MGTAIDAVVCVCMQSTVFKWTVLGRSITLMLVESVVMFAVVLALQQASADSDPWRSLAQLMHRRLTRLFSKLRYRPFARLLVFAYLRTVLISHNNVRWQLMMLQPGILLHCVKYSRLVCSWTMTTPSRACCAHTKGSDACHTDHAYETIHSVANHRTMLGVPGGRGLPDHRQLPSSDVEMIVGAGVVANGHAGESKQPPSDAAVYSLEDNDEDADLAVGTEILGDGSHGANSVHALHVFMTGARFSTSGLGRLRPSDQETAQHASHGLANPSSYDGRG